MHIRALREPLSLEELPQTRTMRGCSPFMLHKRKMKEKTEPRLQMDIKSRTCRKKAGLSKTIKQINIGLSQWSTMKRRRSQLSSMEGKVRTRVLVINQMKISNC